MRMLTIPDIHGEPGWKKLGDIQKLLNDNKETPLFDYYIFLGDYMDSFHRTDKEIEENLLEIIRFKNMYLEKIVLLLGNHDFSYLYDPVKFKHTGFRPSMYNSLHKILNDNKNKFQFAFQIKNYLWSHAGLTQSFYDMYLAKYEEDDLARLLNKMMNWISSSRFYLNNTGRTRGGGSKTPGPLWADKLETIYNFVKGYHQIVGHTAVDKIETHPKDFGVFGSITYTDVLQSKNPMPYILEI